MKKLERHQHVEIQRKLKTMSDNLCSISVMLENGYPLGRRCPRPIAAAMRRLEIIRRHLLRLRVDELEEQYFYEHSDAALSDFTE